MNKLFNMIAGENGCCILLYGNIGDYDRANPGDFAQQLMDAEKEYGPIDVRINSKGGDVYAGIAIFNALRQSKADITIYIDGIAASMASVVAFCGKRVKMSKYARLMIHSISGGAYGNKEELKACIAEIEALEATLCAIYADKSGRTVEEIKAEYFDGKDHWLTAEEALAAGLIDEIVDAEPIAEDLTPDQVFTHYQNQYNSSLKTENTMFKELRKRPRFANCATDEAVLEEVVKLETEAAKVPELEKTNKEQKEKLDNYAKAEAAAQEKADKEFLDKAQAEERFPATQRPTFEALLKSDRNNTRKAIEAMPAKRRIMEDIDRSGKPADTKGPWDRRMEEIEANKLKRQ